MNEIGFLYSQIGYDLGRAKRALVRGPRKTLNAATLSIQDSGGELCVIPFELWGERWGSTWSIADFSRFECAGNFCLEVKEGLETRFRGAIEIGEAVLWNQTARAVSIEQAERRHKVAQQVEGQPLGWFDAGMLWQEANSHCCFLLGLCDLWEKRRDQFSPDEQNRLLTQLLNGGEYLARLQDLAGERGFGAGAVLHQAFFTQGYPSDFVNPSDGTKAAAAWARLSAILPDEFSENRSQYRKRALQTLEWLSQAPRWKALSFLGLPHGLADDFSLPDTPPTPDLAMMLWATLELNDSRAFDFAAQLLARQIGESEARNGVWGHFRLFEKSEIAEKMWTHGTGREGYGYNNGQTFGQNLFPLFRLLEKFPRHSDAPHWKAALENYLHGYFLPGCEQNPFGIVPNGHVADEGFLHFAGLWHGHSAIFGLGAALALEFNRLFPDPRLPAIATANLQWLAGLNVGVTRENLAEAVLFSMSVPPDAALPASLICGIGQRHAGCWLQIKGSIANGFSNGAQFVWDKAPTQENDLPLALTDEDWITHAGGFLMGLSRL